MLRETEKKMNQQEMRMKWHNFVPMVLCYSSILQRRFHGRRRCRNVRSLLSCIWGYLVSMQKDLVFLHLFPVGCPVRAVVGRESWSKNQKTRQGEEGKETLNSAGSIP